MYARRGDKGRTIQTKEYFLDEDVSRNVTGDSSEQNVAAAGEVEQQETVSVEVEGTVTVDTPHPATLHPAGELSSLQVIRSRAGAVEEVTPSRHINRATVLPQWSMPPPAPAGGSSTSSVETKEGRPVTVGMRLLLT